MAAVINEMQKQFAVEYVMNGGKGAQAARRAGYSKESARTLSCQLLSRPHIQEFIRKELEIQRCKAGAVGLHTLYQITQNEKASTSSRVSAARALLEYAGMIGGSKDAGKGVKEPGEMTAEELRAFIDNAEGELAKRARPVTQTAIEHLDKPE